jgi:hypothetical protein
MKIKYKVADVYGDALRHEGKDVFHANPSDDHDLACEHGQRDAAEVCAADFWRDHASESQRWPMMFTIVGDGDEELGFHKVDAETARRRSASEA